MRLRLCAFADEAAEPIAEQISALKENNIPQIELRSVDGINVKDLTDEKAQEIARALKEAGISVWSLGSPLGKSDISADFSQEVAVLKRLLQLCRLFECDKIRVFSFFTKEYARDRQEVTDRMRRLVEIASEQKIRLFHENEKDIYGDRTERVADLLQNVPGLCSVYDPANYVQVGETPENMSKMAALAGYLHIKDVLRTGELVPAGEGDGMIAELIGSVGTDMTLTLEPHLKVFSGYAAIDNHEMKNKYSFSTGREAFDFAARALKNVLLKCGYRESGEEWIKP